MNRTRKASTTTGREGGWSRSGKAGSIVATGLFAIAQAEAQPLDGNAIQELALQGMWVAEESGWGYWSWNADDTVCLRIYEPTGDCADTGTWEVNDDVMCYELDWWGEAYDVRASCFTVNALGDGRYEALFHGRVMDSTFIHFGVVE